MVPPVIPCWFLIWMTPLAAVVALAMVPEGVLPFTIGSGGWLNWLCDWAPATVSEFTVSR